MDAMELMDPLDHPNSGLRTLRKSSILLSLLALLLGSFAAFYVGIHDAYMHLGMYFLHFLLLLRFQKALFEGRPLRTGFWLLIYLAMLAYFALILWDLVPARLEVLPEALRMDGLLGPELRLRERADLLFLPMALLGLEATLACLMTGLALKKAVETRRKKD